MQRSQPGERGSVPLGFEGQADREGRNNPDPQLVSVRPFAEIGDRKYLVRVAVWDPGTYADREKVVLELSQAQVRGLVVSYPPLGGPTEPPCHTQAPSLAQSKTEEEWVRIDIP